MATAEMTVTVQVIDKASPFLEFVAAAIDLDHSVLTLGMTHQTTIGTYIAFRVALRALQDTKEDEHAIVKGV